MPPEARELLDLVIKVLLANVICRLSGKSMYLSNSVAKVGMGEVCISEL